MSALTGDQSNRGTTDEDQALVASLVGRTIVKAEWLDTASDYDWTGHEECNLTLDDGRTIRFGAWGHDAWGATVDDMTAEAGS